MTQLDAGLLLLLGAPLVGALVLGILASVGRRAAAPRGAGAIAVAAVAVTVLGLAVVLAASETFRLASATTLTLGFLDPGGGLAGYAWSLAPALVGVAFLVIAVRARSRLLAALSLAQLAVSATAALTESLAEAGGDVAEAHGALVLDPLAGLLLAVSAIVGGLIVVYAVGYEPVHLHHRGLAPARSASFLAWLLVFLSSMNLLVLADDLRLLVVGWELTTLCSFALIGFDGDATARVSARRALAYNLVGGIALGGAGLLLGPGATLSGMLADVTGTAGGPVPTSAILALVVAGMVTAAAIKSALLPAHPWLLGAMVAAAPVSALLHASAMVKAGSYLLLRISPALAEFAPIGWAVAVLGGITFAGAALVALREHDLKRVLAYSTISSLGLIAAGAGLASPAAISAGALLLGFHAVAKALAFLVVGGLEQATGTRDLEALVGIVRRKPAMAAALVVAAAAMALPPFGLVVAKWALIVLGMADAALVVILSIGAAAGVALWTAVTARLLVRRAQQPPAGGVPLTRSEQLSIGTLAIGAVAGLVLAGPFVALVADPVATAIFGINPDLAAGWAIALAGARFAVPGVAILLGVSAVVATIVGLRVRATAPEPYLAGVNLSHTTDTTFRGPGVQAARSLSGGFYWGAETGDGQRSERTLMWVGLACFAALVLATVLAGLGGV